MSEPARALRHRVFLERSDDRRVAWLGFVSEHRLNLMTIAMFEDMATAIDGLLEDPPRVLVLTGGGQSFTGGADVGELRTLDEAAFTGYLELEIELLQRIERLPWLTIASIVGSCIGNGAELALACDLRIGARSARFGFPEVTLGFSCPVQRLARHVGIGRCKEIVFFGRAVPAGDAHDLGLLTQVVPDEELESATASLALELAALSPLAVRLTKEAVHRCYDVDGEQSDVLLASGVDTFRELTQGGWEP